jgi:alpha-tubulin suppressor-like RCC1 family protein
MAIARSSPWSVLGSVLAIVAAAGCATARGAPATAGDAFVEVDAVFDSVCARRASGRVECAGDNQQAQLGTGTLMPSDAPIVVASVGDAIDLAADSHYGCAVRRSGQVGCWGRALPPPGLDDAVSIALFGFALCAARKHGDVACWDPQAPDARARTPRKVDELAGVVELSAAAGGPTCARTRAGRVWCANPTRETDWAEIAGVHDAIQVDAGGEVACALVAGGRVQCWGTDYAGSAGDGAHDASDGTPVFVSGLRDAVQVSSGPFTACAVRKAGEVVCWGECAGGVCGEGGRGRDAPEKVPGVAGAVAVSVGAGVTCAVRAQGDVVCWGDLFRSHATLVAGLDDVVDVIAAGDGTCALRKDGAVRCWGGPHWAGGEHDLPAPRPVAPKGVATLPNLTFASGGDDAAVCARGHDLRCHRLLDDEDHLIAVRDPAQVDLIGTGRGCALAGGAVWCWGGGGPGLGDDSETPARVAGLADAVAVVRGWNGACALRAGGGVVCWGADGHLLARTSETSSSAKPVPIPTLRDAVELDLGGLAACARLRTGRVACWHTGDGKVAEIDGLDDAVQVAVGSHAACAVRTTGRVVCWGAYDRKLLRAPPLADTSLVEVPGLRDAVAVTVGNDHACARLGSGQVACWGENDRGQVGDGSGAGVPAVVFQ